MRFHMLNAGRAALHATLLYGHPFLRGRDPVYAPFASTLAHWQVERLTSVLGKPVQLGEKVVAMNKLASDLGSGCGRAAQESLRAVAGEFLMSVPVARASGAGNRRSRPRCHHA